MRLAWPSNFYNVGWCENFKMAFTKILDFLLPDFKSRGHLGPFFLKFLLSCLSANEYFDSF